VKSAWLCGKLRQHFSKIVEMQGGDLEAFMTKYAVIQKELDNGEASDKVIIVKAAKGGKLETVNGVSIGNFMVDLNAGRKVFGEPINHDVSM
jgi:thymidine phosphorylase